MGHYIYDLGAFDNLVPTRLRDGDQLRLDSDTSRSLAHLYPNIGPIASIAKIIVQGNGFAFNSQAIEGDGGFVEKTGGKKLSNGRWVFSSNSIIKLPAGGPRPAVGPPAGGLEPRVLEAGVNPALVLFGIAALGAVLFLSKKKKVGRDVGT